jgi:hypothetical protein
MMAVASSVDPRLLTALRSCVEALRPVTNYKLPPALDQRMLDLGERKEFLEPAEYEQLLALIAFAQDRTLEKLRAELALRQIEGLFPEELQP